MPLLARLRVLGDGFSYKRVAPKGSHVPQRDFSTSALFPVQTDGAQRRGYTFRIYQMCNVF